MKQIVLLILIFICRIYNIYPEQNYNYYIRNINGSYYIANIEEKRGVSYFKYIMVDDNKEKNIIGYYYNTDIIKFVDIINADNNIESSKYFDSNNDIIYEINYIYDKNKRLISLVAECASDDFVFRSVIEIVYINNIIILKANRYLKNTLVSLHLISNQLCDDKYFPLYNETVIVSSVNGTMQTVKLIENYRYEGSKIQRYEANESNLATIVEEYKYNENLIFIEENRTDIDGIFYSKTTNINGIFVKENIKARGGFETESEYYIEEIEQNLFIKYNHVDYSLICDDEIVTIDKVEHNFIPKQRYKNLRVKLDPFFDFRFVNTYFSKNIE